MHPDLAALRAHLVPLIDLRGAAAVLAWDRDTHMPPGGAPARGRQLATLSRLSHEAQTAPELERLLIRCEAADLDGTEAAEVRRVRWELESARRVPTELVVSSRESAEEMRIAWLAAKEADDPSLVLRHLARSIELSREWAACFPDAAHPADPQIEIFDPGTTSREVGILLEDLRAVLVPMVAVIAQADQTGDALLHQPYDVGAQRAFGESVATGLGYDQDRGRQDLTEHPFMIAFSTGDVRITTQYDPNNVARALFSTIHETGHALYEQQVDPALEGTVLRGGTSSGVHESQSRLYENMVGRSRGFWQHWFGPLARAFPDQLAGAGPDDVWRAVNTVTPRPIRRGADEVTYNLHIIIRVQLEHRLLDGSLDIADLPDAWNSAYEADLGVTPTSHTDGVLQDVHWYSGLMGGRFQSYSIGNVLAGQLWAAALAAHPEIPDEVTAGASPTLTRWLGEQVHRHGRARTPAEVVEGATGKPLAVDDYASYLRSKYSQLLGVDIGHG